MRDIAKIKTLGFTIDPFQLTEQHQTLKNNEIDLVNQFYRTR